MKVKFERQENSGTLKEIQRVQKIEMVFYPFYFIKDFK